jgi:uncharacterized protein YecE (DUF72 family)
LNLAHPPYYIGCPSWSEKAWRESLYPPDAPDLDLLGLYAQVFNAVEGNTTFYARPKPEIVQRWADALPEHFRFSAKIPRDISHAGDLREHLGAVEGFQQLLAPLGSRLQPLWLQLSASFGPHRLNELAAFIDALEGQPLAVEVRNMAFFSKGEDERQLNRLLLDRGVERICLDSRPLFSSVSTDPAVLHAQSKKPKVPPRPAALTSFPQVRFIGGPDEEINQGFIVQWAEKVAGWIEEGRTPSVFLHTPDNIASPQLARRFHHQLMTLLPGLPDLPQLDRGRQVEQLGLL